MTFDLTTEADLAELFGISVDKVGELRRRHKWPHVRLTRTDFRYTPEQVAAIVTMQTVEPTRDDSPALPGQTARSRRRAS